MSRFVRAGVCAAVLVWPLLAGCSSSGKGSAASPCTSPVRGTVHAANGTVPPPFHYEWTLTVAGTTGKLSMTGGYGSGPTWTSAFTAAPGADARLCEQIRAVGGGTSGPIPAGGGTVSASLTGGSGKVTYRSPGNDDAVIEAAMRYVPKAAWNDVNGSFQDWSRSQQHS